MADAFKMTDAVMHALMIMRVCDMQKFTDSSNQNNTFKCL